jgi:hypothetical protein
VGDLAADVAALGASVATGDRDDATHTVRSSAVAGASAAAAATAGVFLPLSGFWGEGFSASLLPEGPPLFGLSMPPKDTPFTTALFLRRRGPVATGVATADGTLVGALVAAKVKVAAAQERVRATTLAWEWERTDTNTFARRVAEAELFLASTSHELFVATVSASHG